MNVYLTLEKRFVIFKININQFSKQYRSNPLPLYIRPHIAEWCVEHLGYIPKHIDEDLCIMFEDEDDAMLFQMKWL